MIQQHQGTSLVYYFYKRALQQLEDARAGGKIMKMREDDIPEVPEESFRYRGPKPQTKESAIISLADMVEGASRSLEKPTPQKIEQLVTDLIDQRIADHQLDECELTLREGKVVYDLNGMTRPDWDKLPRDYRQTGDARWDAVTPARRTQSPR